MSAPLSVASKIIAVAASDTVNQPDGTAEAIYVTTGGVLAGVDGSGNAFSLTVPAGIFPLKIKRINVTATTATGLFLLY